MSTGTSLAKAHESNYHPTIAMRSRPLLADKLTNDFAQWARASLHKENLSSAPRGRTP